MFTQKITPECLHQNSVHQKSVHQIVYTRRFTIECLHHNSYTRTQCTRFVAPEHIHHSAYTRTLYTRTQYMFTQGNGYNNLSNTDDEQIRFKSMPDTEYHKPENTCNQERATMQTQSHKHTCNKSKQEHTPNCSSIATMLSKCQKTKQSQETNTDSISVSAENQQLRATTKPTANAWQKECLLHMHYSEAKRLTSTNALAPREEKALTRHCGSSFTAAKHETTIEEAENKQFRATTKPSESTWHEANSLF